MITDILPRLDRVKPTRQSQWLAACPAHKDNSPSLALKELQDGRVLIHCWSGCNAREITSAIGLDLRCLYPPPEPEPIQGNRPIPLWKKQKRQAAYKFECLVMAIFTADVKANYFNVKDLNRFFLACDRVRTMKEQGVTL